MTATEIRNHFQIDNLTDWLTIWDAACEANPTVARHNVANDFNMISAAWASIHQTVDALEALDKSEFRLLDDPDYASWLAQVESGIPQF